VNETEELHHVFCPALHYESICAIRPATLLPSAAPDNVLNNVLVESYALHLQNLIEFLYWSPTRG